MLQPRLNSQLQDRHPNQKFDEYEQARLFCAQEVQPENNRWSKRAQLKKEKKGYWNGQLKKTGCEITTPAYHRLVLRFMLVELRAC